MSDDHTPRAARASLPPLTLRDRVFAWIVTGPVGRVVAFFADLATYWWRSLRGRAVGRGER